MTHLAEVEEDDGELSVVRFVCEAAPDALCRSWCVDGCEDECVARDVYVSHAPDSIAAEQAPDGAHRFVPMDPPTCRVVDYLGAGDAHDRAELHAEDEPLRPGRHPIVEEWDGDCYLWTYAEPEPEPAYPGHP